MANFELDQGLSKVLGLNIVGFTSEKPDNYTRVKKQLWRNSGWILPKGLWKSLQWWNIWRHPQDYKVIIEYNV
jgi:hypothetical protein